jgi:O-antigen/teichoic acid export membrane protein
MTETLTDENTKKDFRPFQYLKNIITNGFVFVVNTVVSFWFTPYLKNNLGIEVYGLIPLATSVTGYLGIITQSINSSVARYLTIELRSHNDEEANRIFNTAFFGILFVLTLAVPLGAALIFLSPRIFDIPLNQERGVQVLFLGTVLAFMITAITSNFSIASYARNRFDLINLVSLSSRLAQVAIVAGLFALTNPSLYIVAGGIAAAAAIGLAGDYYFWRKLLPQLRFNYKLFTKSLLRQLMGTSTWLLINRMGALLFLNIEMIVANKTLTLEMAGMYAALITVPANLRGMGTIIGGVWGPTFLSKYSRNDFMGIDRTAKLSMKLIGLAMALPVGFLIGAAQPFLTAWLGPEFEAVTWVMIVMIAHLSLNLAVTPLFGVQVSINKVKAPAQATLLMGVINVLLLVVFSRLWGPLGIALGGGVMLSAKNLFFTPIYTARALGLPWWNYFPTLLPNVLVMLLTAGITYLAAAFFQISSMFQILGVGAGIAVVYLIAAYWLGLNANEKAMMKRMVSGLGK